MDVKLMMMMMMELLSNLSKVQVFDTLQVVNCFKVESDSALLSS